MNEPLRTLQIVGTEPAGFCDPESGVCHLPADQHTDSASPTAAEPDTPPQRSAPTPVR